eukprot:5666017-Pyramimonas_sp.AAC.1
MWRLFRSSQPLGVRSPRGMAQFHVILGETSLRWTPQQPSKMTTLSQIAIPPGMARFRLSVVKTLLRWAPQQPSNVATVSQFAVPT